MGYYSKIISLFAIRSPLIYDLMDRNIIFNYIRNVIKLIIDICNLLITICSNYSVIFAKLKQFRRRHYAWLIVGPHLCVDVLHIRASIFFLTAATI